MKSVEQRSEDLKCGFLCRPPLTLWDCLFLLRERCPGNLCLTAGEGRRRLHPSNSSSLTFLPPPQSELETCSVQQKVCGELRVTTSTGQRIQLHKLLPDQLIKPRTGGGANTTTHTNINNMQQGEQEPGQDSSVMASSAAVCPRGPDPVRTGGDSGWRGEGW